MSSLDELFAERRSIRKYRAEAPPETWIEEMLSAAALAPSSENSQPVRFIRIMSPEIRTSLHQAMEAGHERFLRAAADSSKPKSIINLVNALYRFSEFMFRTPVLMAVGTVLPPSARCRLVAEAGVAAPEMRWEIDADITVGLALQAFTLKGQELGLGSCILTAPCEFIAGVEEIIGVTDLRVKCFLTLGFPDEAPPAPKKKGAADIYRIR